MKLAIVGGGPSAFYLTQQLLKQTKISSICLFERRLVPYGLVRYGVAPDHPEVKNVIHKFDTVLSSDRVRFFGGIGLRDSEENDHKYVRLDLETLKEAYHAVVLAYGASKDKFFRMN